MPDRWVTHKFGGTSLGDASSYAAVEAVLASSEEPGRRAAVVVSAMRGTTDALIDLVERAADRDPSVERLLEQLGEGQTDLITSLIAGPASKGLIESVQRDLGEIGDVLRATAVMGTTSASAIGLVAGYGELWSARILSRHLEQSGRKVNWLDARQVLTVSPGPVAPAVDWESSARALESWLAEDISDLVVITGFIASDLDGAATTLGRNGSDYSASIFAALLGAESLTIWTDVDGVMTADPELVPQAHLLDELSYDEAMELAYFGANVIHPATLGPTMDRGIPVRIRNTFNPASRGTLIHPAPSPGGPVKGFASIGSMALLNVEGTAMIGVPGISERLFGSLRDADVSVVLISQGSSEHSICFAIPEAQAERARQAIETTFRAEKSAGHIQGLEITEDCTILAAVGDGMSGTPGIAARFFGSLARAGVNVKAIAQGSSERNISVVIDGSDAARALRAAHSGFYLSRQTISIGLIGPGHVGGALLDQLAERSEWLKSEFAVDLRVRAIATSSMMLLEEDRVDLADWRHSLATRAIPIDVDTFVAHISTESVPHSVIIDCTADEGVALRYHDWLSSGVHVITPNKKAGSGPLSRYRALREASRRADARFFYETTVGAALPVLKTLQDLVQTGDQVRRVEGIFSGTLSYLFNQFDGSVPFSEIVARARKAGYTEPDPREDLSGMDVARKVVITAREMGLDLSLEDLDIEGLVPPGLESGDVDQFLERLGEHDGEMLDLVGKARARGEVLRFVGVIEPEGKSRVRLESYPVDHPFARIQLTDNIIQFQTDRYNENPLVVQGPGAGPAVTAGGVFADVLRLASYLGASI